MTSRIDCQRLRESFADQPEAMPVGPFQSVGLEECRPWLEWSASQIDACLAADSSAYNELLAAFARVAQFAQSHPAPGAPDLRPLHEHVSMAVVALQSHDRITQQLAHVAAALREVHAHMSDPARAEFTDLWLMLRERQAKSFSTPEERDLFAQIVSGESREDAVADGARGEIDLFENGELTPL